MRCEFVCGPNGTATSSRPRGRPSEGGRSIDLSAPSSKWSSSGALHGGELPLMYAGQGAPQPGALRRALSEQGCGGGTEARARGRCDGR